MHKATCADCGKECQVPFKPDQADQFTARMLCKKIQQDLREDIKLNA